MVNIGIIVLVGIIFVLAYGFWTKSKNQKIVNEGGIKCTFLLQSGTRKRLMGKLGEITKEGQRVDVAGREGKYLITKESTFYGEYPEGTGIWNRFVSVSIPEGYWYAGVPPAISRKNQDIALISASFAEQIADQKVIESIVSASQRNYKLEDAIKDQIDKTTAYSGFIMLIGLVGVMLYFVLQLQGDINDLQNQVSALRTLMGG